MSEPPLGVAVPDTRLHPIYLILGTAKTLRQAIPFLLVTILGGAPWWVNVALFALVMAIAIAQWHVKKYSVVGGVLLLRSGLVNRSVRVVPITRITALAAFQSLTQRLVGVFVAVIAACMIILPPIRYRVFWYAISSTEIDIQSGIIFIKRSLVPMRRVQTLRSERGPMADHYRMTTLKIRTAAGSVSLSGLDRAEADELCERISRMTGLADDV